MNIGNQMAKEHQRQFNKYFDTPAIWYQPAFGLIFGVTSGVMLSQLIYWHDIGSKKDWTYKTMKDMRRETGLTRTQQETAINRLTEAGILEVKNKGIPQTRHFKLNLDTLHEALPSLKKTCNLNYPNPPNYTVASGETITKITRETTTKNTKPQNLKSLMNLRENIIASMDTNSDSRRSA